MKTISPLFVATMLTLGPLPAIAQTATEASGDRASSASGHSPSPGDAAATVASDPFVRMDQDGDGYISRAEATGRVRSAWSKFDADGDGRVSQSEYARGAN